MSEAEISQTNEIHLDSERQQKAKRYARIQRRLMVVDMALGGLYAIFWLASGWSTQYKQALLQRTSNDWLLVLFYVIGFGGLYFVVNMPISYYGEYILPHQFGLSNQTIRSWISDQIKGILVGAILGGMVLEIIYAVLRLAPTIWWIWTAILLLLFNVILANLAPVLLMPIFYKVVPLGEEHADLASRLMRLAERAGTYVKGVYKFDMSRRTKAANAAFTGLGNTRRIILGDTLLNEFTTEEIETVMAHELGHQANKDIPLGIVVNSLLTVVGLFVASLVLNWGIRVFGFTNVADISAFPLLMLVMGLFSLATMPLGNGFSRWRERRADEYALRITHNGEAYSSALIRLANQNLADADPESWEEWLFYSHPPLGKRIAMAQSSQELER